MALLSDALNSFLDVFSYSAIHISVSLQDKQADRNHPFGHRRAEPIAGFVIAIFAALLGATIIKDAFLGIFEEHVVIRNIIAVDVMIFSIVSNKITAKKHHSPALEASFVDSRNDVFASLVALLGMLVGGYWDHIAGLLIGIWIIYSGWALGYENLHYLMGRVPPDNIVQSIEKEVLQIPGVKGINDLSIKIDKLDERVFKKDEKITVHAVVASKNLSPSYGEVNVIFDESVELKFRHISWQKNKCKSRKCETPTPYSSDNIFSQDGLSLGDIFARDGSDYYGNIVVSYDVVKNKPIKN